MSRARILVLFLLLLSGCTWKKPEPRSYYIVAYPDHWHNIRLYGTEQSVTGFSSDLIYAIAKEANVNIRLVMANPDSFAALLDSGEIDGILTAIPVNSITEKFYDFTKPYFVSGNVVIVRSSSPYQSPDDIQTAEIAYDRAEGLDIIQGAKFSWLLRPYDNPFRAIEDVLDGQIDGMILNYINASRLQQSLYRSKLRILLPALTTHNIRLAVRQGQNHELIELFNNSVTKFMDSSKYTELLQYWGIQSQLSPKKN